MKKSILFIALAAVLLSFVSYEDGEESAVPYGYPDSTVKAFLKSQESKYSAIPYFAKLDDQYLFYVVKGEWLDTSLTQFAKGDFLMGIVNERNEVILPVEYNKIYNPDATARGYIEIEKNGKRGLVNYHTKKVIAAEYDVIYEPKDWESIAVGRIGNNFYRIFPDGRRAKFVSRDYENDLSMYDVVSGNWTFEKNNKFQLIFDLYPHKEKWGDDTARIRGVLINPSFLCNMKFDEKISEFDPNEQYYGTNVATFDVGYLQKINENVYFFITDFIDKGVMERGWAIEHHSIVATDSVGSVLSFAEVKEKDDFEYFYWYVEDEDYSGSQNFYSVGHRDDSLVMIKCLRDSILDFTKYDIFSHDYFYKITTKGKVERLESNRIFDITKYVEMYESDLEGVFINDVKGEYNGSGLLFTHMQLDDLELMRNEIFADYGYKFKNEKWKKYFEAKTWYKAKYDNVEQFLTPIDKHNIDVIKKKEELLKKEGKLSKPKSVNYAWGI
jgi:hypothetical protein